MELTGLHFLLTYQCTFQCDHCFVWGSPRQHGTMTLPLMRRFLRQAAETGSIKTIAFEGGEPFLYYPTLLGAVQMAAGMGFDVNLVTNGYWATDVEDAVAWLSPLAGLILSVAISSDLYHYNEQLSRQARNALVAAERLGITARVMSITLASSPGAVTTVGELPPGESGVMYRGRAAARLAQDYARRPAAQFTACPHENLRDPKRVHLDALGNLHLCQGIVIGNLLEMSLRDICATFDPDIHPIVGPLLNGGPLALAQHHNLVHEDGYVDACHMCYQVRQAMRSHFPAALGPDQMYGLF